MPFPSDIDVIERPAVLGRQMERETTSSTAVPWSS